MLFDLLDKLERQRDRVNNQMHRLEVYPLAQLSDDAAACHLRPWGSIKKGNRRCLLCTVHDQIEDYESLLFRMNARMKENGDREAPSHSDNSGAVAGRFWFLNF